MAWIDDGAEVMITLHCGPVGLDNDVFDGRGHQTIEEVPQPVPDADWLVISDAPVVAFRLPPSA